MYDNDKMNATLTGVADETIDLDLTQLENELEEQMSELKFGESEREQIGNPDALGEFYDKNTFHLPRQELHFSIEVFILYGFIEVVSNFTTVLQLLNESPIWQEEYERKPEKSD